MYQVLLPEAAAVVGAVALRTTWFRCTGDGGEEGAGTGGATGEGMDIEGVTTTVIIDYV